MKYHRAMLAFSIPFLLIAIAVYVYMHQQSQEDQLQSEQGNQRTSEQQMDQE